MKTLQFSILILLSFGILAFLSNTYAQDHTRWSLPDGARARLGKGRTAGTMAYSPDGSLLAVASTIGIWIYDADTDAVLDLITGSSNASNVAFSPDGKTLAAVSWDDDTVRLWEVRTGQHKVTLTAHTTHVEGVAFSPDGDTLATGNDLTVQLWDAETGQHKTTLTGHTGAVTSVVVQSGWNYIGKWRRQQHRVAVGCCHRSA